MVVRCPAKINLFLSVGPPEPNGYHPVRTVLQTVGLFDELTIDPSEEDEVVCDWPDLPEDNTVSKAIRYLRELAPLPPLRIELSKRIPSQAGLGGGSSDAAGVIRFAQKMFPEIVDDVFSREVAVAVGSDVPFFLVGGRARATGFGERLDPLPDLPTRWAVIVKPDESVSTADAYRALDSKTRGWKDFSEELYNDFERVAPSICSEAAERLQIHGASGALLCGSGSAVFGLFDDEDSAKSASVRMRRDGFADIWTVPTITREESLWTS